MKTAFIRKADPGRQSAIDAMGARIESGARVIVGTLAVMELGSAVGDWRDQTLVISRRATREEFLLHAPVGANVAEAETAPFYWELRFKPAAAKP